MRKESFFSAWRVAGMGILLALVIVLQAFGGTVSIGAVQLNFTLIPIVLGAIVFGPWVGGFLGLACGVVVLVQVVLGAGLLYPYIWAANPIATTLTCLVKTTVAGILAGYAYQWIAKKNQLAAVFVASGIVPVVNTALFIIGCLFMTDGILAFQADIQPDMVGANFFIYILVGLVTFNFFIEFAINLLVSPALYRVIGVVAKRVRRK